jgi:subtilisin family serine protease
MRNIGAARTIGAAQWLVTRARPLLVVLAATALLAVATPAAPAIADTSSLASSYRPGVVLVGFKPAVSAAQRRALERRVAITWLRPLATDTGTTVAARSMQRRRGRMFIAAVKAGHEELTVRLLERERGLVRFAELDYTMHASGVLNVPNDASFALQWGSSNLGQTVNGIRGVSGADDRAAAAWTVTTGSRSIVIGEVDTGVDYLHPDLAANIWTNPGGIGGCPAGTHGYNVVAGICDPADDDTAYGGHGTHVAGIMGAVGNNGIGVAGVNWKTTILPVKWLDATAYGSTDQLISALDWLVKAKQSGVNIRIINDSATFVGTPYSQALSDEIDLLGANNILFVTAAGNTTQDDDDPAVRRYPCGYDRPTEICVTATAQNDRLPAFANWGAQIVDLGAPGDNIYSTLRNGSYGYISGGSMAAAQVSGAAALVLSKEPLSVTGLRADLLTHVDVLPSLVGRVRTGGRLDICRAISACATGCKVPRLVGRTLQQAGIALRKARCLLGPTRKAYSSRIRSGHVISQGTKSGTGLPIGTAVTVVISRGTKTKR